MLSTPAQPETRKPTAVPLDVAAPPTGRQWHRDDWDASMLPEGWRPLMTDEYPQAGDECRIENSERWSVRARDLDVPIRRNGRDSQGRGMALHHRTRRDVGSAKFATVRPFSADPTTCPHDGGIEHEMNGSYCSLCGLELVNDRELGWIAPAKAPTSAGFWTRRGDRWEVISKGEELWLQGDGEVIPVRALGLADLVGGWTPSPAQ